MKQKLLRTISMILVVLTAFSTGIISKAGAEEQKYWINPNGGSKYHRVHHCPSIHPRYYDGMIEITEDQLSMNPYNMLSPCNVCMDLDPADFDLPIGEQGNLTSAAADTETLQDLVIQHAKDNLTEVYGYTEEQANQFQFLFHSEGELEYWPQMKITPRIVTDCTSTLLPEIQSITLRPSMMVALRIILAKETSGPSPTPLWKMTGCTIGTVIPSQLSRRKYMNGVKSFLLRRLRKD